MTGVLAGLRVLDLADQSGALAGKLLAGLGADVVLARAARRQPAAPHPTVLGGGARSGAQPVLLVLRRAGSGARAIRHVDGDRALDRLAARADVVIETGPPGSGPARAARSAAPVVASITPFGQDGPYRDWRASDTVAQAMGGMLAASGHADGPPLRTRSASRPITRRPCSPRSA